MADFKVKRRNAAGAWVTEFDTAALNAAQLVQDGRLDAVEGEVDVLQTDLTTLDGIVTAPTTGLVSRVGVLEGATDDGLPLGTYLMGGWDTDPAGYLILNGATVIGGAITYPEIATMFPSWVSGNDLILPNADDRVPLGDDSAPGVTGGSMTHTLAEANLAAHDHTMTHGHADTLAAPAHTHAVDPPNTSVSFSATMRSSSQAFATGTSPYVTTGAYGTVITAAVNIGSFTSGGASATALTGGVTDFTGSTVSAGSGTPVDHTPAHLTVRWAVKAAFI